MAAPDQNENDETTLRDSEVALMDTLKAVFEIIIAKRILPPKVIDEMLARIQNDLFDLGADLLKRSARLPEQLGQNPPVDVVHATSVLVSRNDSSLGRISVQ